nr:hypothetical protein [Providencia alcalifaciens]
MDIIDQANKLEQLHIQAALSNRQPVIKSINGMCIWCEDMPAAPNSAYCSKECGDDDEQYKRKNGWCNALERTTKDSKGMLKLTT